MISYHWLVGIVWIQVNKTNSFKENAFKEDSFTKVDLYTNQLIYSQSTYKCSLWFLDWYFFLLGWVPLGTCLWTCHWTLLFLLLHYVNSDHSVVQYQCQIELWVQKSKCQSNLQNHHKNTPKHKSYNRLNQNLHQSKTHPVNQILNVISLNFGPNHLECEVTWNNGASYGSNERCGIDNKWER